MDDSVSEDKVIKGFFNKVIALHDEQVTWNEISHKVPLLPKGWYELSRLPREDRVEFTEQYWFSKLVFSPQDGIDLDDRFREFFNRLEDVSIFLTQETKSSPFHPHMIYSFTDDFFFHGEPPAQEEAIFHLKKQFESINFPTSYLSFLQIHDGFSKCQDSGIIKIKELAKTYLKFQELIEEEILLNSEGVPINPSHLIPFYESRELHQYQCFYTEWFEDDEMGNVSYDDLARHKVSYLLEEGNVYRSFLSWFISYLEEVNDV